MKLSAFIHQKSYERIVFMLRKHPIVLVPAVFTMVILLVAPIALNTILVSVWPELQSNPIAYPSLILLGSMYFLAIGLFFFTYFVTFYLDLLIVTNDRLLHIEQHGLFSRSISELDLCNIQDVTSEVHGFFPTLFKYGTIHIQTAGAMEKFIIHQIPEPEKLRQALLDLAEEDRKYASEPPAPLAPKK